MNKKQKQVQQSLLKNEKQVGKELEAVYSEALQAIENKLQKLLARQDANTPTVVYQVQYQQALKKQINGILDQLHGSEFETIDKYLNDCYANGYTGALYDITDQLGGAVPFVMAPDPGQVVKAVQLDSKISSGLYTALGEDVAELKKKISATISRGVSTGMSYGQMADLLSAHSKTGYNNAIRIIRTEGHRIQIQSGLDACQAAKDSGCDVVKQWDATLDGRTRPHHKALDGQIREVDEDFETPDGLKAQGPGMFGKPAEDCNCRCAVLQRAKWALDDDELQTLKDRAAFFGLDKADGLDAFKAAYIDAAKAPTKPKKEILTKKKLEQKLADGKTQMTDLEKQLKAATDMATKKAVQDQIDALQADMDNWDDLLDKKLVQSKLKALKKDQILAQDAMNGLDKSKVYHNIWKDDVTILDYGAKQGGIPGKKAYFQGKLATATDPAEIAKWQGLLDDLDDFEKAGSVYFKAETDYTNAYAEWAKLKKAGTLKVDNSVAAAYTQDRKDAALWAKNTKAADTVLRDKCGEVWRSATKQEKAAIYDYTAGSGKFNRPLSGFEKPYAQSGTGWEPKWNKGVNKVWIDYEGAGDEIRHMTNIIAKSSYDEDIWLQRGCGTNAMESFFGLSPGTLGSMSEADLQQFVGRDNRMYAFVSTGVAKGKGFGGEVILNIYAPKGTQMMYAEPFSCFGNGGKLNWDGMAKQSSFGSESEMIIQRGAKYKVTKIEKNSGTIFLDLEVHPEDGYDLIQQDPNEWKGSKAKGR